ncbi:MAG: OmpA family protein [Chitinivibrionales bacterium]|nr:OmpA family protein [Chitinivibrionales bacterium]
MPKEWHDINEPGFGFGAGKKEERVEAKEVEIITTVAKEDTTEVRLVEGAWRPGPNGYRFNEACKAFVKAEFLKDTARKRVKLKIFVRHEGEDEDLKQFPELFLDDNGEGEVEVTLYYGEKYYDAWCEDPSAKCHYLFRAEHSKGVKELESPLLEMPHVDKVHVDFVEIPDVLFNSDSAVPCLDENATVIGAVVAALNFAAANPSKEIVVFGHTDTEGREQYNYELSQARAQTVKALLGNDAALWKEAVGDKNQVQDYQLCLKSLTDSFGWSCDPGAVDNADGPKTQAGVKSFQAEFNERFGKSISVDGAMGPQTWEALFTVLRSLIEESYRKDDDKRTLPQLSWGNDGSGVYPCGESFPLDGDGKDNYASRENRRVEIAFWDTEQAPVLVAHSDTATVIPKEECPVFDESVVEKKPLDKDGFEPVLDGEIFLNTSTDELGIISPGDMKAMRREIEIFDAFLPWMKAFVSEENMSDKKRAATIHAVMYWMRVICEERDEQKVDDIVASLDSKIDEEKRKYLNEREQKGNVSPMGHKLKAGNIQEYWWVTGKRMIRVRNKNVPKRYRWFDRKTVGRKLRSELGEEKGNRKENNRSHKELEIKLFEKKLFPPGEGESQWCKEFNENFKKDFWESNTILDGGIGAQFLRYSYEGALGASIKWGDEKSIKAGAKIEGSASLTQAQGEIKVNLPNESGFDLIDFLRTKDPGFVDDDCGSAFLMFQIAFTGSAFVGVCASIQAELGVVLDPKSPEANKPSDSEESVSAGLQAGVDFFAGAKVDADAKLSLLMRLIDDYDTANNMKPEDGDWQELGDASFGTWAAIGAGISAGFKVGYFNGRVRYHSQIGAAFKIGAGTDIKGNVSVANSAKFIWTVVNAFNWKNISDVLQDNVYDLFQGLMANCFLAGNTLLKAWEEGSESLDEIMDNTREAMVKGLGKLKEVDDTFDKFIPGYSGFKQFNSNFLILRSTYNYLKRVNTEDAEKENAIRAVKESQANNRWHYATWQMKQNLIYEMRHGGAGLGGFSEEDKEDAVITVLKSCRHDMEFEKIVQGLKMGDSKNGREKVDISNLLDFKQQKEFDDLKIKYHYQ